MKYDAASPYGLARVLESLCDHRHSAKDISFAWTARPPPKVTT